MHNKSVRYITRVHVALQRNDLWLMTKQTVNMKWSVGVSYITQSH